MNNILGLDLGSHSIGWCIRSREADVKGTKDEITNYGVVVFPKGVGDSKTGEYSYAAERTKHRLMRRQKFRKRIRKYHVLKLLIAHQMIPLSSQELGNWYFYRKGIGRTFPMNEPFQEWLRSEALQYRAKGVTETLTPFELGRVIYYMAQRRGFWSNRKDRLQESEAEERRANNAREQLQGLTPGQAMWKLHEANWKIITSKSSQTKAETPRFRGEEQFQFNRTQYESELLRILEKQGYANTEFAKKVMEIVFFQRPLRSQKHLVGKCKLEKGKRRIPKGHFLYEEFRMWQFINNLRCGMVTTNFEADKRKFEPLTLEEKKAVVKAFYKQNDFQFSSISKIVKTLRGIKKGEPFHFSHSKDEKLKVSAASISHQLRQLFDQEGDDWQDHQIESSKTDRETGEIKPISRSIEDVWHVLYSFDDEEKLRAFGQEKLNLSGEKLKQFMKIRIPDSYGELSRYAVQRILRFLKKGYQYDVAVFLAKIPDLLGEQRFNEIETDLLQGVMELKHEHKQKAKSIEAANNLLASYYRDEPHLRAYIGTDYETTPEDLSLSEKALKKLIGPKLWATYTKQDTQQYIEETATLYTKYRQEWSTKHKVGYARIPRFDDWRNQYLTKEFEFTVEQTEKLYHHSAIDKYEPAQSVNGFLQLGSPEVDGLKNPMAMRTLFELRQLINDLLRAGEITENTRIHVEMSRELNSFNMRKAISLLQREREAENDKYRKEILKLGVDPEKNSNILRYRLWMEQDKTCLYTGKHINVTELFDDSLYDFEHTVPRSLSKAADNMQENLTLCNAHYNRKHKGNKLPKELANWDEEANGHQPIATSKVLKKFKKLKDKFENDLRIAGLSRGFEMPEDKSKRIVRKHLAKMKYEYYRKKISLIEAKEIPEGFKGVQAKDTEIVGKYAIQYLRSAFEVVHAVKGAQTAIFRKSFGLQQTYKSKDRKRHIHHAIDALVLTYMTKQNYAYWTELLKKIDEAREEGVTAEKDYLPAPFEGFVSFVKAMEQKTLVYQVQRDKTLQQAKRRLKLANGSMAKLTGASIRNRLHQETFYAALCFPALDKDGNEIVDSKTGKTKHEIKYGVRKALANMTAVDLKNVVDPELRKALENTTEAARKDAKGIWFNGSYVKKVRCFAKVSNPIAIKQQQYRKQTPFSQHKEDFYVTNEANYLVALYEGIKNNKVGRKTVPMSYFELSLKLQEGVNLSQEKALVASDYAGYPLRAVFKKGQYVLFYENDADEIDFDDQEELYKRLYVLFTIEGDGRLIFKHHMMAGNEEKIKEYCQETYGAAFENKMVKGISSFEADKVYPKLRLSAGNLNVLVEGEDFELSRLGKIQEI